MKEYKKFTCITPREAVEYVLNNGMVFISDSQVYIGRNKHGQTFKYSDDRAIEVQDELEIALEILQAHYIYPT
ncbi:hypothetical protein [Fluviispira vulneris]|uniref:hypothetical protein n=1 Tax=Fluviispira vulneris TaxID=2763012 RepID=UPI0016451984|nr:hypothetical protein [Fluviispira vulneris]